MNSSNKPISEKVSDPISIVSHQLKNPISVLKAYLEVLISGDMGEMNDKQREYLEDCLINIRRMSATVTELLDVSKIEENRLALNRERVNLSAVTKDIVNEFFPLAKASNAQIFVNIKDDFYIFADLLRVREVVENFISNAVQYKSPAIYGKIYIKLTKKNGDVLFACKDNGIGIPENDKNKVFTKFYRSQEAANINSSGTGLGLYIDKAIIELSGGKIWFENNIRGGVTFYFSLPIME